MKERDAQEQWEAQERTVTLTNRQWSDLVCYLLLSSHSMEKEAESWAKLAQEINDDGSVRFANAASNAECQSRLNASVAAIREAIDAI